MDKTPFVSSKLRQPFYTMNIYKYKFPNRFLVLSNSKYIFKEFQDESKIFNVIGTFNCGNIATVTISAIGTFGFIFQDNSELASIDILKFNGNGSIPEEVMKNDDVIHQLQENRIQFVNLINALFWGRISAIKHVALVGAIYNGQNQITGYEIVKDRVVFQKLEIFVNLINQKLQAIKSGSCKSYILEEDQVKNAISFIKHVLERQNDFEYADLKSCMVMNYQAAILHNLQHAAASLVLNFSVVESLLGEMFFSYGLIYGCKPKPFASQKHPIQPLSKSAFKKLNVSEKIETLYSSGLINHYLHTRIEKARELRNKIMHKGVKISPKESGECQTIVGDLWDYFIDKPFALNAAWSYSR
jgi:hypothetical protein